MYNLITMNSAAGNTDMHISLWHVDLQYLRNIQSKAVCSSTLNFMENLHIDFYGVEPVHISTSSVRGFFSPYPCQQFFFF